MAEPKILYIYAVLVAVLAAVCPVLLAQTQGLEDADQWGKAFESVQLVLYLDPHPPKNATTPPLRIAIRNTGASAKKIVLGSGCGSVNETNAITLDAADDRGRKQEFRDISANLPCAGRLLAYEVALPPGGFFSTPLSLQNYGSISPVTHTFEVGFKPGQSYTINAAIGFDASAGFDVASLIPLTNTPPGVSTSYEMQPNMPVAHSPEHLISNDLHVDVPAQ